MTRNFCRKCSIFTATANLNVNFKKCYLFTYKCHGTQRPHNDKGHEGWHVSGGQAEAAHDDEERNDQCFSTVVVALHFLPIILKAAAQKS